MNQVLFKQHAANEPLAAPPPVYRAGKLPRLSARAHKRPDGTLILMADDAPRQVAERSFSPFVQRWARERGDAPALCERDANGQWRRITWGELWQQVQSAAAALLDMGLSQDRPLMLLSGNSIEMAVLMIAAEHVGVPAAPVSPAYSLMSQDFARLRGVAELVPPAAVFVQSGARFGRALQALSSHGAHVVAVEEPGTGRLAWAQLVQTELTPARLAAIDAAHAAIQPGHVARVLFTSGSTGLPKGVATTYEAVDALVVLLHTLFGALSYPQPVFLDWLPWHHAFGLQVNLNRAILTGGTHYIDDGKPLPGQFERTLRSLREVSPTVFNTVPSAWALLAAELERDPVLARSFFAQVSNLGYGGASLPHEVWLRVQRAAEKAIGMRVRFNTGLGSTETMGCGTFNTEVGEQLGNVGVPSPGCAVKLLPLEGGDGRYELRIKLPFAFGGYVKRPELSAAALDEEGFFLIGDAVRLEDPADPARGLRFAGRVVEDFKLGNGTWVRTGAVRLALLDQCAPLLSDAVICGHDQDCVTALAWPQVAECRRLSPELAECSAAQLVVHPKVIAAIEERLARQKATVSLRVERVLLMAEPPSLDANEIADKGYVNQAATRARRADLAQAVTTDDGQPMARRRAG